LAQPADSVLSVNDGKQVRSIARLVNGQWVNAAKCFPRETSAGQSSPGRLVVSGNIRLSAVRAVTSGSPEWVRLAPTIVELFARREREQRLASDRTSDAPRAVDWIYSAEGDPRTYYFEASRRVASAEDPDNDTDPPGTIRIAVAGFLQEAKGRIVPLGTKSELRWEQDGLPTGPNRPDLMPLGIVGYGNKSAWVMKGQSGPSSWFTLYEADTSGTRTALTVRPVRC
jgi:hypothetical protein